MKLPSMKRYRLKQALDNLTILERNVLRREGGEFKPTIKTSMYLIECLRPVIDIYPTDILRNVVIEMSFTSAEDLENFLSNFLTWRIKSAENYHYNEEELSYLNTTSRVNLYQFIFNNPNVKSNNQLYMFLEKLYGSLETMDKYFEDKERKRSSAKISYLERTSKTPLTQIASILEAIAIGLANE